MAPVAALAISSPCSFQSMSAVSLALNNKNVDMYARGMSLREIRGFLAEQYATLVAPDFISSVTNSVMSEVSALDD